MISHPKVRVFNLNKNKPSVLIKINPEKPFYRIVDATIKSIDLNPNIHNTDFQIRYRLLKNSDANSIGNQIGTFYDFKEDIGVYKLTKTLGYIEDLHEYEKMEISINFDRDFEFEFVLFSNQSRTIV